MSMVACQQVFQETPGPNIVYNRIYAKDPGTKNSRVFHLVQWQREPATLKTANGRPVGWSTSSSVKNYSVSKHSRLCGFIHEECFDTHIRKSVRWLRSSVRQNVGLQNQMSEVQILSGSP